MDSEELFTELKKYFPNNLDLMRHLHVNACWEYQITDNSIDDDNIKLLYYLYKKDENTLEITKKKPDIKPDLILYFTEKAILNLIQGIPSAEEYYARYREVMDNPKPGIKVDNLVNKARLKLWKIGYKSWQKDFKF
jgi:hypothetical protein